MATTLKQIEDLARNLLDDERGEKEFDNKTDIFPWIHSARTVLRGLPPEVALAAVGATITALVILTAYTDNITEPDKFAECLAEYVVYMCLMSVSGDKKRPVKAEKHLKRFEYLAAML